MAQQFLRRLGGLAAGTGAVDGSADFADFSRIVAAGGSNTWHGSADFDELNLYMEQVGVIADHRATVISHQLLTISDPTVVPGTTGTMYLAYSFGGVVTIDGGPGNAVVYSLSITQDVNNAGIGGTLLEICRANHYHPGFCSHGKLGPRCCRAIRL